MNKVIHISRDQEFIPVWNIPGFIAGALEPYSKVGFSETKQAAIVSEHQKELERAALNGLLVGRNPLSKIPEPFTLGEQLKRQLLTIEETNQYTSRFGIEVHYKPLPEESGRYTLEEAARKISTETGEGETDVLDMLVEAVQQNKLPLYKPGSDVSYKPNTVMEFYEEAFWDDLNKWLKVCHPRIAQSFPEPSNESDIACAEKPPLEPFSHPPQHKDEWFEVIEKMMRTYKKQHGFFPTSNQAWSKLWSKPPAEFGLTTGKDRFRKDALLMGGNTLNKKALYKRFRRWTGKEK